MQCKLGNYGSSISLTRSTRISSISALIVCASTLTGVSALDALAQAPQSTTFVCDVMTLQGNSTYRVASRVDVYVSVPYETLDFTDYKTSFVAEYKVLTTIRDSSGKRVIDSTFTRSISETDYAVTKGKTGKADNAVKSYTLAPGTYRIDVLVTDVFGRRDHSITRRVVVPSFTERGQHLSSILLVSDIEQRGSRFSIVPYVGDIIWSNELQLFAFFEFYPFSDQQMVSAHWSISALDGRILSSGKAEPFAAKSDRVQSFVPLMIGQRMVPGTYTLRLRIHPVPQGTNQADTSQVLAETSRPYIIPRSTSGSVLSDLARSIRQLIYVASQSDIDQINAGATEGEKLVRFEDYWKAIDPTPATVRNEALEDYFGRVEQANKRFKSYTDGWLTDMGRVFIIFGEPASVERFTAQNGVSIVVRWNFANGTIFTFEDSSGFGDFRLRTPLPAGSKYRYRR